MPEDVTADGDLSFDEWRRDLLSRVDTPTAPAPLTRRCAFAALWLRRRMPGGHRDSGGLCSPGFAWSTGRRGGRVDGGAWRMR